MKHPFLFTAPVLLLFFTHITSPGAIVTPEQSSSPSSVTSPTDTLRTFRKKGVIVQSEKRNSARTLRSVEGAAIYEAKKSELIIPDELAANRATNNARQVFAKVAGVNVWESDGAGLQLGIGARGLSPNRTANFNTRQNGYDMSADALGYPENYYSPPIEALERIEVVRGAASLQYGTQFGGMVNFVLKRGTEDKPFSFTTRQTLGAWGFWNAFQSVGGTIPLSEKIHDAGTIASTPSLNYYGFYQHKQGAGWRPNSGFSLDMAYASARAEITPQLAMQADVTFMRYLAQQPGGLTDKMFDDNPLQSLRARNWFRVDWHIAALTIDYAFNANTSLNSRTFAVASGREALGNLERINVVDFGLARTLISGSYNNIGNETRLLHRYALLEGVSTLVAGIRAYKGLTQQRQGEGSSGSDANFQFMNPDNPENSDYTFPGQNYAAFAENIFWLAPNFSLTPGIRCEHIATNADGYWRQRVFDFAGNIVADNSTTEHLKRSRTFALLGVGVSYRLDDAPTAWKGLEMYANFSQNFRAITFSDLRVVNPNFVIDSALQDERGFNADVGVRGDIGAGMGGTWIRLDATLFYLQYSDRIGNVQRSDKPPLFLPYRYRTNVGDSRTLGAEALVEADWTRLLFDNAISSQFTTFVNAAALDARYVRSRDFALVGKFVELAPPLIVRSGAAYREDNILGGFQASLQYSYTAEHFTDATNAVRTSSSVNGVIPAYSVWDISAKCNFAVAGVNAVLEVGINNLLDARYFTRRADGYPGPGIIPSDGRSWYCTLEVRL